MEKTFVHGGRAGVLGICSVLIGLIILAGSVYESKTARINILLKQKTKQETSFAASNVIQIEGFQNENL